jgi:hypothetical protein
MKLWKVCPLLTKAKLLNENLTWEIRFFQPIAWSFSTSGSTNIRVYNNWIYAISDDMDKVAI